MEMVWRGSLRITMQKWKHKMNSAAMVKQNYKKIAKNKRIYKISNKQM